MFFNDKAATSIEFDKIREMLAECALTEGAKCRALALSPSDDVETVKRALARTTDAKRLYDVKGMPSFGGVKDCSDITGRALKGATLTTREILDCADILRASRGLIDYIQVNKPFETVLDEIFGRLIPARALEDKIYRAIVSEDLIADEASPTLADIRRKIAAENNRIREVLQRYISGTASKFLQENIVTMRGGRYVIPVKAECKGEIKGLIHDTSSSGATVFVEPMPVVDANNELRVLHSREENEIERILSELSAEIAQKADILMYDYENIISLSYAFACASLSVRLRATEPQINENKRFIELRAARHPLINRDKVVPVDIAIGKGYDTIIITGPNTGGKTVTLKTLGLFSVMAQSGLHIPADEGSSVCIFDSVLADIGDDQSIEQSLSTFSSHMVNIVNIINRLTPASLVLFDELGVGTDPVEGAALAMAVIEYVRKKGVICAATTHYAELKAYALKTVGVRNASCEFDVETLSPTYKLIIGTPGKSNAFAISARLGLLPEVVESAKGHISADNRKFEDVIGELEAARLEMEEQKRELERSRAEYEKFRAESEAQIRKRVGESENILERAQKQATTMIESARASSNFVFERLEKVKRAQEKETLARELDEAKKAVKTRLREQDNEFSEQIEKFSEDDDYTLPRDLKLGDEVYLTGMEKNGKVASLPDKKGSLFVLVGTMRIRADVKTVRLLDGQATYTDKTTKVKKPVSTFTATYEHGIKDEIDLRGLTGEEAWDKVDKYLDSATLAGFHTVRLIHGKGTGALRTALWKYLKGDKRIKSFRIGQFGEGDGGVTVAELK